MSEIGQATNATIDAINKTVTAAAPDYVRPFTLDFTGFTLSMILMLLITAFIILSIFGRPVVIAAAAKQAGKSIIEHFNTPKSAEFKSATISGEAFQYANIRDGTVSATPESVESIGGLTSVVTFAQLGVTIPVKILAAISTLTQAGINDHKELKVKYTETRAQDIFNWALIPGPDEDALFDLLGQYNFTCSNNAEILNEENEIHILSENNTVRLTQDPETGIVTLEINKIFVDEFKTKDDNTIFQEVPYFKKDEVIISGYDFENFKTTLKQNDEEKLIPLIVEQAPKFTEKNITADYNESKILITKLIDSPLLPGIGATGQLIGIAIAISLMVLVSTVIK